MPFNASGTYTLSDEIANSTSADATELQAILDDIETALNLTFLRAGSATATGQFLGIVGATSQYSFSGDANTGFGSDTGDEVYLEGGGVKTLRVNATGMTTAGTHSATGLSSGLGHVPVGSVVDYAGTSAPTGWLLCFGQSLVRTDYAALFTAIGTQFGAADGTHFSLPDCQGRVTAGKDNMSGVSADRLTAFAGSLNGDTLGAVGGSETITLDTTMIPSHTHDDGTYAAASDGAHTHTFQTNGTIARGGSDKCADSTIPTGTDSTSSNGAHTHDVTGASGSTGGGAAHANVQPTIILNKIIFAGV